MNEHATTEAAAPAGDEAEDELLSHEDAAAELGISPGWLYVKLSLARKGNGELIEYEKDHQGRNWYRRSELQRYKASKRRVVRASVLPQQPPQQEGAEPQVGGE